MNRDERDRRYPKPCRLTAEMADQLRRLLNPRPRPNAADTPSKDVAA